MAATAASTHLRRCVVVLCGPGADKEFPFDEVFGVRLSTLRSDKGKVHLTGGYAYMAVSVLDEGNYDNILATATAFAGVIVLAHIDGTFNIDARVRKAVMQLEKPPLLVHVLCGEEMASNVLYNHAEKDRMVCQWRGEREHGAYPVAGMAMPPRGWSDPSDSYMLPYDQALARAVVYLCEKIDTHCVPVDAHAVFDAVLALEGRERGASQ